MSTPRKLSAAAVGTPLGIVVAWLVPIATGITVPNEVAVAIGAICTFVASVAIPDEKEE